MVNHAAAFAVVRKFCGGHAHASSNLAQCWGARACRAGWLAAVVLQRTTVNPDAEVLG